MFLWAFLTEILICNRLLAPKAFFRVGQWAEQASLTEYYGVPQEQLNDDRLGRVLDLEKPERMGGLLQVLVWALMVMSLMERAVRRSLKGKPMYGLYPENRPSAAPTGKSILEAFSTLCIVIMKDRGTISRRLADLTEVQRMLMRYMGIPPNRLTAFKRKCCRVGA